MAKRGVQWNLGRTYFRGRELFQVRLPSSNRDHFPPFVNINQTEVEEMLLGRIRSSPRLTCAGAIAWSASRRTPME